MRDEDEDEALPPRVPDRLDGVVVDELAVVAQRLVGPERARGREGVARQAAERRVEVLHLAARVLDLVPHEPRPVVLQTSLLAPEDPRAPRGDGEERGADGRAEASTGGASTRML